MGTSAKLFYNTDFVERTTRTAGLLRRRRFAKLNPYTLDTLLESDLNALWPR